MTVDTNRPDIIVQTFYFFDKNPNYKGANKILIEKRADLSLQLQSQ